MKEKYVRIVQLLQRGIGSINLAKVLPIIINFKTVVNSQQSWVPTLSNLIMWPRQGSKGRVSQNSPVGYLSVNLLLSTKLGCVTNQHMNKGENRVGVYSK